MARYLLIVARHETSLWRYLKDSFAGDDQVEVIQDRRRGDRRQRQQTHEPERRRTQRRGPWGMERDPRYRPVVIIRREEGHAS